MARRKKPAAAIQSAERVLSLLDILAQEGTEMSLTQISQRLGVHISTAHRLATPAMYCGYVEQNPQTDTYRQGLNCLHLPNALQHQQDLRRLARARHACLDSPDHHFLR